MVPPLPFTSLSAEEPRQFASLVASLVSSRLSPPASSSRRRRSTTLILLKPSPSGKVLGERRRERETVQKPEERGREITRREKEGEERKEKLKR